MDRWRTQTGAKRKYGSNRPAGVPVFTSSRPCDEICKKKEEVGEDENSKNVLGAANASRANKSRPVSYFFRRVAASSLPTLSSAILKSGIEGKIELLRHT